MQGIEHFQQLPEESNLLPSRLLGIGLAKTLPAGFTIRVDVQDICLGLRYQIPGHCEVTLQPRGAFSHLVDLALPFILDMARRLGSSEWVEHVVVFSTERKEQGVVVIKTRTDAEECSGSLLDCLLLAKALRLNLRGPPPTLLSTFQALEVAGPSRDQLADDDVFLETDELVLGACDSSLGQDPCGLLE